VPHALIGRYGGRHRARLEKFADLMDGGCVSSPLVDFENDCVGRRSRWPARCGERSYGVRIDTSETLVDSR